MCRPRTRLKRAATAACRRPVAIACAAAASIGHAPWRSSTRRGIAALFAAYLLGAASAQADPADDCNPVRDLSRQLRGCTQYIQQGKGAPQNLATAYLNRANIYARRGRYALAFK